MNATDENAERTKRLYATDDAAVWTDEFMSVVENGATVDWGLMVGWFANAIETAKNLHAAHRPDREDVLGAVARGWCHPENARKSMDVDLAVSITDEVMLLLSARVSDSESV